MATHDYVLDNATGANFRAALNNALAAIVSNNSSSSEPSTKYAYQWWADTNEGVLKIRNSANDGWVTLLQLDGTLTLEDGSASAPALGFRDDLNTGIFSSAADNLDITTGGTTRVNVSSTGINVTGTVTDDGATHDGDVTFTGASANIVFDKSDNQLEFADNAKAEFGTGGDLEIYHDGTDNHIVSTNGQINIQTNSTENSIQCIPNGAVKLFHDNNLQVITSSTGIDFADNKKANFGGEDDLQIYHDGSNSYIDDSGTGNLLIRGNNIELHKYTGEDYAKFIANGAVELYFDDSKKFETLTDGAKISHSGNATLELASLSSGTSTSFIEFKGYRTSADIGRLGEMQFINQRDNDVQAEIEVFANGDTNAYFDFKTNNAGLKTFRVDHEGANFPDGFAARFGASDDLKLYHDGSNSYIQDVGTGGLIQTSNGTGIFLQKGTSETLAKFLTDGACELSFNDSVKLATTSGGIDVTGAITVNGSALSTGGGKVLQVVSVQVTSQSTYNGTSFDNISGLNASITPASSSNKVLVMFNLNVGSNNNGNRIVFRVARTGEDNDFVGDASGSRSRASAQMAVSNPQDVRGPHISYLSSPSSTSAVSYQLQAKLQVGGGSEAFFGSSGTNSDSAIEGRCPQSIILMEIEG